MICTTIAGPPLFSDDVLAEGFACASTDKGDNGRDFHTDGARPGDAVAERVTQLTVAAREALQPGYG